MHAAIGESLRLRLRREAAGPPALFPQSPTHQGRLDPRSIPDLLPDAWAAPLDELDGPARRRHAVTPEQPSGGTQAWCRRIMRVAAREGVSCIAVLRKAAASGWESCWPIRPACRADRATACCAVGARRRSGRARRRRWARWRACCQSPPSSKTSGRARWRAQPRKRRSTCSALWQDQQHADQHQQGGSPLRNQRRRTARVHARQSPEQRGALRSKHSRPAAGWSLRKNDPEPPVGHSEHASCPRAARLAYPRRLAGSTLVRLRLASHSRAATAVSAR